MALYSIGEISSICNISVHRLRNYHKKGLIYPEYIDENTGRRYYSEAHIFFVDFVDHLRKMNFGLSDIKDIVKSTDMGLLQKTYKDKLDKLEKDLTKLINIRTSIIDELTDFDDMLIVFEDAKIDEIDKVILKNIPERKMVFIREKGVLEFDKKMILFHNKLQSVIKHKKLFTLWKPMITFDASYTFSGTDSDIDICKVLISDENENYEHLKSIPAGYFATLTFRGGLEETETYYNIISKWCKINNFAPCDNCILKFHTYQLQSDRKEDFIRELQILVKPVKKVKK
jgi:DNA-binding transcriptional MerR regulator